MAALDNTTAAMPASQKGRQVLPTKRLSMRRIKEVLRLRFEAGLGHRQIARSCSLGVGTVHDYLKRAEAAGLKWPSPDFKTFVSRFSSTRI